MAPSDAVPELGGSLPRRGSRSGRALAAAVYRVLGWRFCGTLPDVPKAVIVVAHHTSNWDFVIGAVAMFALGVRVSWLGKHTIFRGPLGPVMRWLGGIPVHRSVQAGVVEQTVDAFRRADRLLLALSPEGTRRAVPRWRTGFYHMARRAGVPIVPIALDWGDKAIVLGPALHPSGNVDVDLRRLGSFFAGTTPRRREGLSPVIGDLPDEGSDGRRPGGPMASS